tara:strand:+ start:61 stop:297 length:237 start_codon:yes stop_codon:yes gene_type:complete
MIKLTKTKESGWVDNVIGTETSDWVVKKAPNIAVVEWFGWCAVENMGTPEKRFLVRHGMTRKDCLEQLEQIRPELAEV